MLRIQYHKYGGPEVMRLETYELPPPGKNELLVRVEAASINPLDWKLRQGFMKFMMGGRFPRAMGMDFSGIVERVGSGVTGFGRGDAVLGQTPMMKPGAFAEMAITTADLVIRKPDSLSGPAAAALPTVAVTAWRALVDGGKLKAGQSVFINGASGGVGQAAIAVARTFGAVITARAGPSSLASFADLGLARVLDYTQPVPDDLKGAFDVVFDCHGSLRPAAEAFLTRRSGIVVNIDPTMGNLIRSLVSRRHSFIRGVMSTSILQKVAELAVAGQFTLPISRTASLSESISLIGQLEAGNRLPGKSVIVMG